MMKTTNAVLICVLLSGCVFQPSPVKHYDSNCHISYTQFELDFKPENIMRSGATCENESCLANLFLIPLDLLVAGSIVISGNTVFWLEKEFECSKADTETKDIEETVESEVVPSVSGA